MKTNIWAVISLILCLLGACKQSSTVENYIRPVKVIQVSSLNQLQSDYAGIVEAVNYVNLTFRVPGQITNLPIVEGQRVTKGELIAQLDPREINVQYAAAKASYETAKARLERNERLLQRQAVSRQEMEIVRAEYEQARATYNAQSNNLKDTYLYAPFSGFIAKRNVENYQRIQAGMPVAELVDPNTLQVYFTIPDRAISQIESPNVTFVVEFENLKGKKFTAQLKEFVDASPNGAGIPVYLKITDPNFKREEYLIKPGFACNVTMILKENSAQDILPVVPLTALLGAADSNQKYVWIYNMASSTVTKRAVQTGALTGTDDIIILNGVKDGEYVVTAGVTQLTEGEEVKLLK